MCCGILKLRRCSKIVNITDVSEEIFAPFGEEREENNVKNERKRGYCRRVAHVADVC
jgi:hypothetical protein